MTDWAAAWTRTQGCRTATIAVVARAAACSRADDPPGSHAARVAEPAARTTPPVEPRISAQPRPLSPAARAGKHLFFEKRLSASGRQACATCHDPAHAYGPPNGLAVQLGGPKG